MIEMLNNTYVSQRGAMDFGKRIKIHSVATVGGKLEKQGPLGKYLDIYCEDEKMSQDTWENAESEMCRMALDTALSKGKLTEKNVDYLIAGDLMNQCTGAAYGLSEFDIPYFGLYGACSTFAEAVILGSCLISSGNAKCVAAVVSSHFCTAERQFRYPLEYGSFSETTAQNTVTGAGAIILCEACENEEGVYVKSAMPGIVCDRGIKDAANMGGAMCTAAADTIMRYFDKSSFIPSDIDVIATGDLGKEGRAMAFDMINRKHPLPDNKFCDCGTLIYDTETQDVGCGGSGCGCSALVFCGYLYEALKQKTINNCLLVGTGAMMSPQSILQGRSIPAIGHLVHFERG